MCVEEKSQHFPTLKDFPLTEAGRQVGTVVCLNIINHLRDLHVAAKSISPKMEHFQWPANPFTLFLRQNRLTMKQIEN
jgi:hypothetical protein